MVEAPDYPEAVVGWRVWAIAPDVGQARLASPIYACRWEPHEPVHAACHITRRVWRRPWQVVSQIHPAPASRCVCGVHAMAVPRDLKSYILPVAGQVGVCRVIGRVALWGTVVEGTHGWRAARAYPAELWLPQRDSNGGDLPDVEAVAFGLADYAVPTHLCDEATPYDVVSRLAMTAGGGLGVA